MVKKKLNEEKNTGLSLYNLQKKDKCVDAHTRKKKLFLKNSEMFYADLQKKNLNPPPKQWKFLHKLMLQANMHFSNIYILFLYSTCLYNYSGYMFIQVMCKKAYIL